MSKLDDFNQKLQNARRFDTLINQNILELRIAEEVFGKQAKEDLERQIYLAKRAKEEEETLKNIQIPPELVQSSSSVDTSSLILEAIILEAFNKVSKGFAEKISQLVPASAAQVLTKALEASQPETVEELKTAHTIPVPTALPTNSGNSLLDEALKAKPTQAAHKKALESDNLEDKTLFNSYFITLKNLLNHIPANKHNELSVHVEVVAFVLEGEVSIHFKLLPDYHQKKATNYGGSTIFDENNRFLRLQPQPSSSSPKKEANLIKSISLRPGKNYSN